MDTVAKAPAALRILPFGDAAFLAELPDLAAVLGCYRGLAGSNAPSGVVDIVPAARTVLVTFDPLLTRPETIQDWIRTTPAEPGEAGAGREVRIEVSYGGPDLADVARHVGMSESDVVRE